MYGYYGFLKIIDKENAGEALKEIISWYQINLKRYC
jgi:hypothetical protein